MERYGPAVQNPAKVLGILVLLAACLAGCTKKPKTEPKRWSLDRIGVNAKPLAGGSAELSENELKTELLGAFERSGRFVVLAPGAKVEAEQKPFKAQLDLAFTRDAPAETGKARLLEAGVVLQVRRGSVRHEATGSGRETFTGTDLADRAQATRAAVRAAVAAAVDLLVLELTAQDRSDQELIADLSSTDPRVRDFAVRALADRRNAAAVPALIERLRDPDREVALRSVGALRTIGDPRAVPALIELTKNKDPAFVVILLDVVASIGGEEAEAYLFTLASGHPDETVRMAAEQARKDLEERSARRARAQERNKEKVEEP